jgi:hypothetical protein
VRAPTIVAALATACLHCSSLRVAATHRGEETARRPRRIRRNSLPPPRETARGGAENPLARATRRR